MRLLALPVRDFRRRPPGASIRFLYALEDIRRHSSAEDPEFEGVEGRFKFITVILVKTRPDA